MSSSSFASNSPPSRSPMVGESFSVSRELKRSASARAGKAPQGSTFFGRAGSAGLEVLDTLGSSMTNLFFTGGFVSNSAVRTKVSLLAFEVANTIVKGSNLMQSLSAENVQLLKKEISISRGVQLLVSTDIKELLGIIAADKRDELEIVCREVVRFGDMSINPHWHKLDRVLRSDLRIGHKPDRVLRSDLRIGKNKHLRKEAEMAMQELSNLAQHTAELYHEYHAWHRLEQVYRRKLEKVKSLHLPQKGESLMILESELKLQKKLVRNLKKKSLWSKSLEEVVEKLVDVVTYIRQAIVEAFGENVSSVKGDEGTNKTHRLGGEGLALHYANLISQIDSIASRPMTVHANERDTLYHSLPMSVKAGLRSRLQTLNFDVVMTMPKIKAEMEKILDWLLPLATNTIKAHQSFGWFGEWANSGFVFGKTAASNNIIRLLTLDHADRHKVDQYILDLVILLHCLIKLSRDAHEIPESNTAGSSTSKDSTPSGQLERVRISLEDKDLLQNVAKQKTGVLGVSRSHKFMETKKRTEVFESSRSIGSSVQRDLKYANVNVMDGLDSNF